LTTVPNVKARDLMRQDTPVLGYATTVPEAVAFFRTQKSDFAIVQASPERFQGVLTEASLVRLYLRYLSQPDKDAVILYRDFFEPAQLIHQNETFPDIVKKLMTAVSHRVFVINDQGEVVGYISVKDILPYFGSQKLQASPEPKLANEEMSSDLYLYENFFSQSPFMMHSVNKEGVVQMANLILHRMLGYEYPQLVGRSVFDLYPKAVTAQVQDSLSQIIDSGKHKIVKGQMMHKTGVGLEIEMVSRALQDQKGKVIGTITVSRPLDMAKLLEAFPAIV